MRTPSSFLSRHSVPPGHPQSVCPIRVVGTYVPSFSPYSYVITPHRGELGRQHHYHRPGHQLVHRSRGSDPLDSRGPPDLEGMRPNIRVHNMSFHRRFLHHPVGMTNT